MSSYYSFRVYGDGHLADVLRCGIHWVGLTYADMHVGADVLAFVAQDVLNHSDDKQLAAVARLLGHAARDHKYVVVVSQVPPGWTRRAARGRAGVFYQVDTIIMSRAVERVLRPEQFVVGCADPAEPLPLPYQEYLAVHACPVRRMSYEAAELAKCAINYHLAAQVRTANEIAKVADRVGAEYEQVARALAGDARIGPHAYLRPGVINQHLRRDVETISSMLELPAQAAGEVGTAG